MITKKVNINGLDIYYREGGTKNKPVLLWLDGLSVGSPLKLRLSKSQKVLIKFSEDFNIIAFEYPSFMRSSVQGRIWGIDDYVSILNKFIDKIKISTPIALMGHSMGAKIGFAYTVKYPDKVSVLAISAPPITYKFSNSYINMFNFIEKYILKFLSNPKISKRTKKMLPKYILSMSQENINKYTNKEIGLAVSSFLNIAKTDCLSYANELKSQTFLLAGKYDIFVPLKNIIEVSRLMKNCKFMVFNEGHFTLPRKLVNLKEKIIYATQNRN